MIWHSAPLSEVEQELAADRQNGLTSAEAAARLETYGKNQLSAKNKRTFLMRFLDQLKDVMVIILMAAAVISAVVSAFSAEPEWIEPIIIMLIVIANALLGVLQESKAEAALEALKNMAAPSAKTLRDGQVVTLPATDLVPGDVILLEAGDFIPADARLLESASLKSEESSLTGESVPVDKNISDELVDIASIGDRVNMIYSGCSISYGRGRALVTETGMTTEMGKIAAMLESEEDSVTPLQLKLAQLGKTLGFLALGVCALIFVIGLIKGLAPLDIFMMSVSLAVAAIPEGLPAIVTIVLAIGVQQMVKKNAIVRRLPAVETLGSASVICSDKTGTLTQNRMTMVKLFDGHAIIDVGTDMSDSVRRILELGCMCNDGKVTLVDGREAHIGDPTETSIVACMLKYFGQDKEEIDNIFPRMGEIPFESDRKLMTTINMIGGKPYAVVKGAPDILISRCTTAPTEAALAANESMAREALRVLAVAVKPLSEVPAHPTVEDMEQGLTFIGLLGMIDPPREEAMDAVKKCQSAGIRTVMITGDHVTTAAAIANQLGMLPDHLRAITGAELAEMDDEKLAREIESIAVYARVSPEDKIRIVNMWQTKGQVVAMTGDGVNDAPALKSADIGCAMGITGTDVAKGAAAMVLTDDNFATIVSAVEQGRGIFDNIRKAVHFLLSCNLGEIITVFGALLLFADKEKAIVLSAVQLLWINLVTDSAPALALGMEPVEKDIMRHQPRRKDESIFAHGLGINAAWQGVMFGGLTLIAYWLGMDVFGPDIAAARGIAADGIAHYAHIYGSTMAFAMLSFAQLVHAFNVRSSHSLFVAGFHTNKYMLGAFVLSAGLMLIALLTPLRNIFDTVLLQPGHWLIIVGLCLIPLVVCELVKLGTALVRRAKAGR